MARGFGDALVLASAAASLARLTHREPAAIADACACAVALGQALSGRPPGGREEREEGALLARRFAALGPTTAFAAALDAVERRGGDVEGSRRAAAGAGADAGLAGMLSGALSGAAADAVPAALAGSVRALLERAP
jgi:ADP-ribosylglycohydrolase